MYLKVNPKKITSAQLALIVKSLKNGEVLVYPTDTIYGLGCLANDDKAIKKIKAIKKRESAKPLLVLVSSLQMARKYCLISKNQETILKKIWSSLRPTSVVLRHRNLLSSELVPENYGLAVRLPKSDFLRKMVRIAGVPIVSTSFNLSGQPVFNEVSFLADKKIGKNNPDLIIDGGILNNEASKLVDLMGEEIKIIRQ